MTGEVATDGSGRAVLLPARPLFPVGGFLKQSMNDFPGRISAVVFSKGCNFRCVYCHNPELVVPQCPVSPKDVPHELIFEWLRRNRSLLDAVVVTGGEPTLHRSLPDFLERVRALGFEVKLDTNGTNPPMLEMLLNEGLVDYIAMDIKALPDREAYGRVCGVTITEDMLAGILRSLRLLHESGVACEVRTTLLRPFHEEGDIATLAGMIGVPFFLQQFNPEKTLEPFPGKPFGRGEIEKIIAGLEPKAGNVCLR